jgi:hypothetical protein
MNSLIQIKNFWYVVEIIDKIKKDEKKMTYRKTKMTTE